MNILIVSDYDMAMGRGMGIFHVANADTEMTISLEQALENAPLVLENALPGSTFIPTTMKQVQVVVNKVKMSNRQQRSTVISFNF